jgi:hypothetical protein
MYLGISNFIKIMGEIWPLFKNFYATIEKNHSAPWSAPQDQDEISWWM